MSAGLPPPTRQLGRYVLGPSIAVGGMASVHLGLLSGPVGFKRTVAIKRMHRALAGDAAARATLLDEARVTSRLHHPHVVQTLDVVEDQGELFLVLEYVHGQSLDRLLTRARELGHPTPTRVVTAVLAGVLRGLHAAHEARGEDGQPLELVHRDLSPQNVMVDTNGVPRVLDFGIARARGRLQGTREGQLKGKLAYLSPEQVHGDASRQSDVFAAGVVLFEALTGKQLFDAPTEAALLSQVLKCRVPTLASLGVEAPALQSVLDRALQREAADRYATAAEMADALEGCGVATPAELAAWVLEFAAEPLAARAREVELLERAEVAAPTPLATKEPAKPSPSRVWLALVLVPVALVGAWLARPAPPAAQKPEVVVAPVVDAGEAHDDAGVPELDAGAVNVDAGVDAGVKVKAPTRPPKKKPGCDPPYVIEPSGVKRYKVECL